MFRVIDAVRKIGLGKWRPAGEIEDETELAEEMVPPTYNHRKQYEADAGGQTWRRAYTSRS